MPIPLRLRFQTLAVALIGLCPLVSGAEAHAQSAAQAARPEAMERLVACRGIEAAEARLACYDAATEAFDAAQRQGEVVVVDRAQVNQARRQLFGFELPRVNLFAQGGREEQLEAVETTLVRASQSGDGRWTFTLADESVWRQVDADRANFRNRPGEPVRVRRGLIGSYLMTVGNSRALRVRRQ